MTEEAEQGGIDLVGVGPGDGVRAALDDDEVDVGDQPRMARHMAAIVVTFGPTGTPGYPLRPGPRG